SRDGYLKRTSLRSYGSSQKEVLALKEDDVPIFVGEVETIDNLVFMTTKGRYGIILVHDIEEARWRDIGSHMNQYLKFDPDERVVSAFTLKTFKTHLVLVTTTASGMIKKTFIEDLEVKRTNKLYDVMKLAKGDTLVGAHIAHESDHLLMFTRNGQGIRIELDDVSPLGVKAKGIIGIKLKTGDTVSCSATHHNESDVVIMSERGQFKRIKEGELPINNRATQGNLVVKVVKSNPHYIEDVIVGGIQDDIMLYNDHFSTLAIKDVAIMSLDATFSTATTETDFVIVHQPVYVPVVAKPSVKSELHDTPMKLDI
ncbi:MAG: DNA gyrase C-terminal beta-propeller domain-containing protein, partial [Erysipelothrix sp.]